MIHIRNLVSHLSAATALLLLSACASHRTASFSVAGWEPVNTTDESLVSIDSGKHLGQTTVRLAAFSEALTLGELDYDFDNGAPDAIDKDIKRDRIGFRATFGSGIGGYFQVFSEDVETKRIPGVFDGFGIGGGLRGRPQVADLDWMQINIPFKIGFSVAYSSLRDDELLAIDNEIELGVGASFFGLNPSVGVVANNAWAVHSDTFDDTTTITGSNLGPYVELLYKHDSFPMFASIRSQSGDVESTVLNIGFAF